MASLKKLKPCFRAITIILIFKMQAMTSRIQGLVEIEVHKGTQICRNQLWDINRITRWILRSISELQFVQTKILSLPPYQNISKFQIFLYASLKAAVLSEIQHCTGKPHKPITSLANSSKTRYSLFLCFKSDCFTFHLEKRLESW